MDVVSQNRSEVAFVSPRHSAEWFLRGTTEDHRGRSPGAHVKVRRGNRERSLAIDHEDDSRLSEAGEADGVEMALGDRYEEEMRLQRADELMPEDVAVDDQTFLRGARQTGPRGVSGKWAA